MSKFYVNDLNNPSAQRVLYFDIFSFSHTSLLFRQSEC